MLQEWDKGSSNENARMRLATRISLISSRLTWMTLAHTYVRELFFLKAKVHLYEL